MQDLGYYNELYGINNSGLAVGSHNAGNYAELYDTSTSTMTNLNTLIPGDSGWSLSIASAINDAGQIVGWGLHSGQYRAFLLTPDDGSSAPHGYARSVFHTTRTLGQIDAVLSHSLASARAFASYGVSDDGPPSPLLAPKPVPKTLGGRAQSAGRSVAPVSASTERYAPDLFFAAHHKEGQQWVPEALQPFAPLLGFSLD
jgi:probable HAF family extracellular repeat protein